VKRIVLTKLDGKTITVENVQSVTPPTTSQIVYKIVETKGDGAYVTYLNPDEIYSITVEDM
jgi:hypothetical protein